MFLRPLSSIFFYKGVSDEGLFAYYSEIIRAGIQSVPRGQPWAAYALGMLFSLKTHRDDWGAFASVALEFDPGAEEGYSNYGYILLGSVIEAVSRQAPEFHNVTTQSGVAYE